MNHFKFFLLIIVLLIANNVTFSQNVMLNVLTQNAGIIRKGKNLILEVSITNTNQKDYVGIYTLKVQINVPTKIVSIDSLGCILPTGWKILSYDGASMILSNGMDMISATDRRNLLIAIKGNYIGGPSTISGQLSFSNGIAPGTEVGSLKNDLDGDNYSTTTCTVLK